MAMTIEQAAIDRAVAGGLSSLIGFEPQWRNRLAGLRTNTLVALGSASFVIFEALVQRDLKRRGKGRHGFPESDALDTIG